MTPDARIVVNLLTGFLGAGKTSLLKRLLGYPELAGAAVLINEFGEVGLDHLLLERLDDDVVLLKSGCICCTIRGDLKQALTGLHGRRARGEVPAFDRLVIETTGLADPAPIVATLSADPVLRNHFRMGNIVTVVDAVNGATTLRAYGEAVRQAAVADRIVIAKADLASADALAALETRLAALNPAAAPMRSDDAAMPSPALLIADIHDPEARSAEVRRWFETLPAADGHAAHSHRHDVSRHGDVRAFRLNADAPLDWARFGLWLSMLLNRHGADVLRLKGLLHIDGAATPVVVQGVQHLIHRPTHLAAWPDGVPTTRIVVIARRLDPALVERSFRAFNRVGGAAAAGAAA